MEGINEQRMSVMDRLISRLLAKRIKRIADASLHFDGHVRIRKLDFDSEEEWRYWWLPELAIADGCLKVIREARMTPREKERYTVSESHNILTNAGRSAILGYIGSQNGSTTPFAQQFSIGNFPTNTVSAGDTGVLGEIFRGIPSPGVIAGTQTDISTFVGSAQANGNLTNCGFYGNGATSSFGSGTLCTHSLLSYNHPSSFPISMDYLITQQ